MLALAYGEYAMKNPSAVKGTGGSVPDIDVRRGGGSGSLSVSCGVASCQFDSRSESTPPLTPDNYLTLA
jgi:hypothetical protein